MKTVNSDVAYDYIRKRILNGEYPPGHPLMTYELSRAIGVSRTPVRDALRQLESDGLVSIRARLGASVKKMSLKEFREMCGLRFALESYAAYLAAQERTGEDLREMALTLETMRRLSERLIAAKKEDKPTLDQLRVEDVRFHIAIITSAKSELLKQEVLRLHIVNRVVSGPTPGQHNSPEGKAARDARRREVIRSHEKIHEAIARGNPVAAKDAMERHIQDIIDTAIRDMSLAEHQASARPLTEEELSYAT
ncbi:MAG: GntR family transcriptional regulator [Opitutaceae bacterium]|nr:GntR family transcriptional regulator [Opitutaceae bacterium]